MRVRRIRESFDYKIRYTNSSLELKLLPFRSIISNTSVKSEYRIFCRYLVFKISSKSKFPNNFRNRCLLTGRVRATIPYFKLSRIEFKRLVKQSNLMGVRNSS